MFGKINVTTKVLDNKIIIELFTDMVDRCLSIHVDDELTKMDIEGFNIEVEGNYTDIDGFTEMRLKLGDDTTIPLEVK